MTDLIERLQAAIDASDGDVFVIGRTNLTNPPSYSVRVESGDDGEGRSHFRCRLTHTPRPPRRAPGAVRK